MKSKLLFRRKKYSGLSKSNGPLLKKVGWSCQSLACDELNQVRAASHHEQLTCNALGVMERTG
jgi:hypothetical protein